MALTNAEKQRLHREKNKELGNVTINQSVSRETIEALRNLAEIKGIYQKELLQQLILQAWRSEKSIGGRLINSKYWEVLNDRFSLWVLTAALLSFLPFVFTSCEAERDQQRRNNVFIEEIDIEVLFRVRRANYLLNPVSFLMDEILTRNLDLAELDERPYNIPADIDWKMKRIKHDKVFPKVFEELNGRNPVNPKFRDIALPVLLHQLDKMLDKTSSSDETRYAYVRALKLADLEPDLKEGFSHPKGFEYFFSKMQEFRRTWLDFVKTERWQIPGIDN